MRDMGRIFYSMDYEVAGVAKCCVLSGLPAYFNNDETLDSMTVGKVITAVPDAKKHETA